MSTVNSTQLNSGRYCLPHPKVVNTVDAPKDPSIGISPSGRYLSFWEVPPLKTIEEVADEEIKVAGLRLSKYFTSSIARSTYYTGVSLLELPPTNEQLSASTQDDAARGMSVMTSSLEVTKLTLSPDAPSNSGDSTRAYLGYNSWSPLTRTSSTDQTAVLAFCRLYTTGVQSGLRLFLANSVTKQVHGPLDVDNNLPLSAVLRHPVCWVNDRQLLVSVATFATETAPVKSVVPNGPEVEEHTTATKKKVRTYQDLIQSKYDEELFIYLGTSHFVLVTIMIKDGKLKYKKKRVTEHGLYCGCTVSPNRKYVKIKQYTKTSRMVPYHRFGINESIYRFEPNGTLSFVKSHNDLGVAENIPVTHNSCRTGMRFSFWSEGHGAVLCSVQALDGGDAGVAAKHRDLITYCSERDLFETQNDLVKTEFRFGGLDFCEGGKLGILSEHWWRSRLRRKWLLTLADPVDSAFDSPPLQMVKKEIMLEGSYEDRYGSVGSLTYTRSKLGTMTPIQFGDDGMKFMFTNTTGASKRGNVPYVDIYTLNDSTSLTPKNRCRFQKSQIKKGRTDRIWMSNHDGGHYEKVLKLLPSHPGSARHQNNDFIRAIVSTETPDRPANYFLCDLKLPKASDCKSVVVGFNTMQTIPLTFFEHPYPQLKGYQKQIIKYCRRDGVELSGTLYTPAGYDIDAPSRKLLPLLIWAYPREFKSATAASQLRDSPHRFSRIHPTSPLIWLSLGYAVLDGPAMPIIAGDGRDASTANDTYIEQLVDSAKAAVDYCCRTLEICDARKVAVGGHSYGAFMTANLLAHTKGLFACGIARSGAYNRTLTPFGFQAEDRTFWEAPDIYSRMSPFMNVNPSMSPMLITHGLDDENSGTYPDQSKRMFSALRGQGVICRMVLLPKEGHGYRARESILHCLAETEYWMNKHCLGGHASMEVLETRLGVNTESGKRKKSRSSLAQVAACMIVVAAAVYRSRL